MIKPRGIRNNNPCNLIQTNIKWLGKIEKPTDKYFEQFETMELGIRAAVLDIYNDIKKGKSTVRSLINEFAPINENNTEAYIKNICLTLKIKDYEIVEPTKELLFKMIRAIIRHENGSLWEKYISDKQINNAITMANINKLK